jgi:hypothetical protein
LLARMRRGNPGRKPAAFPSNADIPALRTRQPWERASLPPRTRPPPACFPINVQKRPRQCLSTSGSMHINTRHDVCTHSGQCVQTPKAMYMRSQENAHQCPTRYIRTPKALRVDTGRDMHAHPGQCTSTLDAVYAGIVKFPARNPIAGGDTTNQVAVRFVTLFRNIR